MARPIYGNAAPARSTNEKICKHIRNRRFQIAKSQSIGRIAAEDPMPNLPIPVVTIGLLIASNVFMTFAWYGHLKYKSTALMTVVLVSWGIAFFEYVLQVPANRIGHGHFSAAELKTIQEVITLSVFAVFSVLYLKEPLGWNHLVGFGFIAVGAFFIFHKWG
jgi:uncharacterized protein (DUF486 family)